MAAAALRNILRAVLPPGGFHRTLLKEAWHHPSPLVRHCQSAVTRPQVVLECEKLSASDDNLPLVAPAEENTELDAEPPHVDALSTDLDVEFLNSLRTSPSVAFNLAAFINRSPTLCKLVDLGVDLSWVEATFPQLKHHLLKLNFEKDVVPLLKFLHELKLNRSQIVTLLSRNPFLFAESLSNLQTRVSYLRSKKFTDADIQRIVTVAVHFLSFPAKDIDSNLGFLQKVFHLTGDEVRKSTVQCPKVTLADRRLIRGNIHLLEDEIALSKGQIKQLYLGSPKIYYLSRSNLFNRLEQFTIDLKVPIDLVIKQPQVLLWRSQRVSQRHQYLTAIGRAQYDPTEPGYVSLIALTTFRDPEFCQNVAGTSLEQYHTFLKTL